MSLEHRVIGLLEDDPIMGELLVQRLSLEGTIVRWWTSGREALAEIERSRPEAVVCDIRLPDMSGEDVFRAVAGREAAPPFLFITGYGDIDQAVQLIRSGAGDYLTKPFDMPVFLDRLAGLLAPQPGEATSVLGVSEPMRAVERTLHRLARVRATVLFTGETGAGKEVCARFLHAAAGGATGPFMAVNCAAIPADLLEAEIFGHERGAFTGAQARHLGYAERAGEGTLFLDEIGDLAPTLQAKLLRLVEERQFHRVGGEAAIRFRARVVCATNSDLQKRVAEGRFREDLFYRINVVPVAVPPLRNRPEDVVWLLERFFDEYNSASGGGLAGVSGLAEEAALGHSWPGNVRELRNRVERAVALALGPWIMPGDLFPESSEPMLAPADAVVARGGTPCRRTPAHPAGAGSDRRRDHSRRQGARHFPHHPVGEDAPPRPLGRTVLIGSEFRTWPRPPVRQSEPEERSDKPLLETSTCAGGPNAPSVTVACPLPRRCDRRCNFGRKRCRGVRTWSMSADGNSSEAPASEPRASRRRPCCRSRPKRRPARRWSTTRPIGSRTSRTSSSTNRSTSPIPTTTRPAFSSSSAPRSKAAPDRTATSSASRRSARTRDIPLGYNASDKTLNCPGHYSRFDCERGGLEIWGHATQNLPQYALRIDDKGDIYAEGLDELLYGRLSNVL